MKEQTERGMGAIAVKVSFLGELRSFVRRREMEVALAEGSTVEDLLGHLSQRLGEGFARHLFNGDGSLYRHVSIFVNGSDVRNVGGLEARLAGGEVDVLILPTYGGG